MEENAAGEATDSVPKLGDDAGDAVTGAADGDGTLRLMGGKGADSTGEKHGFKRSIETVQGLFDFDKTKVFSLLSSTLYGPTYGGVKGLLTASTRTNTAGQAESCLLYTSPSPRDLSTSRMPSSA